MSAYPLEPSGPVLCLGEALVDLICERPVERVDEAETFVPHFGGAAANIALMAARAGGRVALAGGVGADDWGGWLRGRLNAAGVDVSRFLAIEEASTALALVTVDPRGEAAYTIYGDPGGSVATALGEDIEGAVDGCGGLFISSNSLVDAEDREVTMRARELALERGRPVVFDPNLRLHRWRSRTDAAASANACVAGALLVRCNAEEAELMTREEDMERAAQALLKAGARHVVITRGGEGAILRGGFQADIPGVEPPPRVLSTIGAGDALTATLLARLVVSNWYEPVIPAALPEAVRASALACERWGAAD